MGCNMLNTYEVGENQGTQKKPMHTHEKNMHRNSIFQNGGPGAVHMCMLYPGAVPIFPKI